MTIFKIRAQNPTDNSLLDLVYDTSDSSLKREDGARIGFESQGSFGVADVFDHVSPIGKSRAIKTLKIQLGLSCNYECTYCSQRFVPRAGETNPSDVDDFLANIEQNLKLGDGSGVKVELWGGEPFVYWKTMKPLVERIREKYPAIQFSTITNGSLLTDDKVDWMFDLGFSFAISHDGPNMSFRGPDPLDDPETRRVILRAYKKFAPRGRISFNAMMHAGNTERAPIIAFFQALTGDPAVSVGEGGVVDAYDAGAEEISLTTLEQQFDFRRKAFSEFMGTDLRNWQNSAKVESFVSSIRFGKSFESIQQKCGMDRPDNVAIDLKGNVLTCQNVSTVSSNPAGTSHLAGNIADMESVKVRAATHLSKRKECPTCPVVHLCMGSCLFLQGKLWEVSCDNSYTDNIGPFAYAIFKLTGFIPVWIEHPDLPDYRKDVFGSMMAHPEKPKKSAFPIPVVAA